MGRLSEWWRAVGRAFWISRPGRPFLTTEARYRPGPAAPSAVGFYESAEWRRLRYRVLRSSSGRCSLCGRSSLDGIRIHVDHIQPRSLVPELALVEGNLQVLCEDCNMGKSNTDSIDWRSGRTNLPA